MIQHRTEPIRVGIVEDKQELRTQLEARIGSGPEMMVSGSWATGELAMAELPGTRTDVVLMDIHLPGVSGIDCVRALSKSMPECRFMMLTIIDETEKIFDSLKAGATGYLMKSDSERLLPSIAELHAGASPMSSSIARKLIGHFVNISPEAKRFATLTIREEEVLRNLAAGLIYKEVGDALGISPKTVRAHCNHIYKKLQVTCKGQAIRILRRQG